MEGLPKGMPARPRADGGVSRCDAHRPQACECLGAVRAAHGGVEIAPGVEDAASESLFGAFKVGEVDAALVLEALAQLVGDDGIDQFLHGGAVERGQLDCVEGRGDPQHGRRAGLEVEVGRADFLHLEEEPIDRELVLGHMCRPQRGCAPPPEA